ncbi:hypothetical protein GOP47_0009778 [Adiantum capillus-veneris]|uniref:Uncharacterized protein n=1 Tax=Adiantum capillus-veneris TaxID=13818 RepID=A0A9D4UYE7_ADICA|nr:hypothetical protein GOP47_0009778 [Adiantum capillus-veneris]
MKIQMMHIHHLQGVVVPKRRPRVNVGTIKDLVDTTKHLTTIYKEAEARKARRFEEAEHRREAMEDQHELRRLDMEHENIQALKESNNNLCSLNKIGDSISSLGPLHGALD